MARSTRSRFLALVACLTLFLAGVPGIGIAPAQAAEPTNPWVGIAPDGDAMWGGSGWIQGNTVAISIDDPDPGDSDYATTATVGPEEWSLHLEGVFDIQPGHLVTATDAAAGITKTHEVRDFTVGSVDTDADTVAGTAPVGTALTVKTFSPESCDTTAIAESDGNWQANFAGLLSEGGQPCDLGPGWSGSAEWYDATDNDHTFMGWGVEDAPTPTFTVETPWDVWSSSQAWVEDDTVTLTIGAVTVATATVERWGPEPWEVGFNFHTEGEHEIIPGDTVTVTATNAGTVKTLDVVAVTVTTVDEVDDTVTGTAPADAWVEVNGGNEIEGAHRSVQADGTGAWTADFSTTGIEDHEQDILDISPGVGGSAEVYDDDQDSTHRGWHVASPWIGVDVTHDELWANDWPLGETLQYTIEDPDTAASPDKSGDMLVVTGGGGQTEAGDRMFDRFDIHAGQVLTVWSGTMSRELLISNLEVLDVDPDTDTLVGTADHGTEVCASTFNAQLCVTADANGDWVADFSTVGGDVRPGDHNGASQEDDDGDQTHFSWHVPPWIYVELSERDAAGNDLYPDRIQLDQWEGPQVTVRVNGLVIATPTVGSEEGYSIDHDVQVGDIIEVFDPAGPTTTQDITKTLEIEDLYITDLTRYDEVPPSTVFGEAAPTGGERSVQASISTEYGWWADRWVNSDAAGAWEADFANPGFGWHEQWTSSFGAGGVTDVLNGGAVRSAIWDGDNDQTQAVWHPTNPRVIVIQGDPDRVEAIDFPEGSEVTVEIDDPVTPENPDWDKSGIAAVDPDKPWSTLLVFELVDYDIPEAATVTASDGVTDVIHDVVSFTISAVDPDADTVSGTAAAGTEVLVEADGNWRYPVADVNGDWTANFSLPGGQPGEEQPVDIQPGSSGRAVVVAEGGSATTLIWQLAQLPTFSVRVDDGQVQGNQWPEGAVVALEIDDPSNGDTYSGTATSSVAEWDPEQTYVVFAPGEEGFTLAAGQTVTMTHGDVAKTTVVTDLTITSVDEVADTVSGISTSGTDFVDVGIHDEIGTWRQVTPVGGAWVADFSVPWQDQPTWNIAPGTQGEANEYDEDGDATNRSWRIANPAFSVETPFDVWSSSQDWVEDDTVTMTIDDPGTVDVDYSDQTTVQRWGPEPWEVGFNFHTEPFEIQPGFDVTITATDTVRILDVAALTITAVNETPNTVSGTAPIDAWVDVNAGNNTGDAQRTVQADGSGAWTADFSTPGTEGHEQNILEIAPGTGGSAQVFDDDGDSTHRGWDLQIPSLAVHLPDNQIAVGGFEPNAPVDVAVDDDGDPSNGVLWSQSGSTDDDGNAGFHPDGLQVEPDMTVTAQSSELFKSMIVTSVRVTDVDYDNDHIFGAADPLSEVRAEIRWDGSEGDNHRIVHADEFGNWMADYTLPGDEQSPDPVDLETWMGISAEQTDEDNDQTVFNWRLANPTFSVETPFDVWSSSQDWVEDDTVTMTIDDPGTVDVDYSDQTTVQRWGPEPWEVGFNFHTEPFEIQPGFDVTITATDTVRILDVAALTITAVNETPNTVSGTAPIDAWVDVNAGNNTGDAQRTVQADGSGAWTADFSTPGTEGHEQNILEIAPGTGGSAQVFDDDGDSTHQGWCFECDGGDIQPIPPIEMQPGEILISQTDGVLWVYDPVTGSLEDHILPFGGIWDIQWLGSDQILIANSGEARIWILDLTTGGFELLAEGDPFQFPIGLALDPEENLWVADGHAGIIRLNDGGAEVVVQPFGSPDGIVAADDGTVYFTAQGGTLYRVDESLPNNYAEVATAEGYGLNGLVMRPDDRVLATSMGPSALITFDPSDGSVSIEDYHTEMRSSEDSAFAASGDIYVADSGMIDEFGDDSGLYVRRATGGLEQLVRGEPLGDTVDLLIYEPSPRLQVYSTSTIPGYTDVVYAEHVSADSTLTIEREGDPLSPYVFDPTEFDRGTATWILSGIFDIAAGDVVTAGEGDRTITHTVTPLAIIGIDHETYTISGVARPDHVLAFNMVPLDPDGGYGPLLTRQISTDPVSGAWSVTLTDPPGPDEEGTVLFGPDGFPGSHGNIYDSDPDGSAETTLDWFVAPDLKALRNPQGIGDTGDMLMGRGWSLSETIEVDVADVDGSAALSTQVSAEWDCGSSCLQQGTWDLDDLGFTLDPGMTVTGYQEWPSHLDPPSSWTTTLEVQRLTVDLVDIVNDVVAGTAGQFATVTIVQASGPDATDEDQVVSVAVADQDGLWSTDFNGLWDVDLGDIGTAGVLDTEGMGTRVLWQAPDPLIAIGLDPNGISGHGWLWHREITLTVDDLGTPEMPDLTVPATSDAGGSVEFDLGGFDLQPGMEDTSNDGFVTRTATIADYAYSPDPQSDPGVFVDPETDTVSGTAPAGSEVCVHIDGAAAPICISVLGPSGTFVPWSISIPGGVTYETACVVKIIFNFTTQTTTVLADPPPTIDDVSISTDPGTGNSGFSFDAVDYGDYSCADPYLLSVEIDWGDETSPLTERVAPNSTIHASHVYGKTGTYVITVTVTEPCELQEFTSTLSVDIPNTAPGITALTGPVDPLAIGTAISASGEFVDPNWLDEHSLTVEWGDGTNDTVTPSASPFTIGHTYTEPGVYRIEATVADDEGGTGTAEYAFAVVYDPLGGFATGAGTIESPVGAYVPDSALTGTASFGFVSKYKKGATKPSGTTEFEFAAGDVFFWSRTFDWLVIAGPRAQFKGAGTINGLGDFGFMVTAVDAKLTESTDVDLFRIKIWDRVTGDIVYDNLLDADDDADPTTEINSGNIIIHKAKPDKRK